ncbi:MAG: YifB family Mg chelatase-like AAA ATPase [Oleiphilaceae bacterium]|nr:YifB family Mg chelatase-like AAA ATPase [Oleiphilaceae bacterium]
MTFAIVHTRARVGIEAPAVTVETHLSNGLPALSIVGLPETGVRESKDRVRSALINAGFEFPARRITINLAPADLPKEGSRFDLPIALGILAASGQIAPESLRTMEFVGELALDGALRAIAGVVPAVLGARGAGRTILVPHACAPEAALASQEDAYAATDLLAVCAHLQGHQRLAPVASTLDHPGEAASGPDLKDVQGQQVPKRALVIAAAGGHNLLFQGPPGTGKSMLASRLPGLLPPLPDQQALEVASVHSVAGQCHTRQWRRAPYRAPHHTASAVALVGGGSSPSPGEISLAHHGVLFLDELPEFSRHVLEVLREPMESGQIVIARANGRVTYPARFQVVAAMNPCPCGYLGHPGIACRCAAHHIERYRNRLSGPLLDRFDLHVTVPVQSAQVLLHPGEGDLDTATAAQWVREARALQQARGGINARLEGQALHRACALDRPGEQLLEQAMDRLGLSARALHRVLRVARTLADLEGAPVVARAHLVEALGYRPQDLGHQ